MTLFKVEGQRIYIFKTLSQDHVPESHTSVMFLHSPLPGGSPAIPLVRADYQVQLRLKMILLSVVLKRMKN